MPGLLQTEGGTTTRLYVAIAAEFVCSFLFAFIGAAAPGSSAAAANGIALAVLVYVSANVSGGHLNPAVTVATLVTGHTSVSRGLAYIVAQIAGCVLAAAMHMLLIPNAHAVGCFAPNGISLGQAFGWEAIMTFLLVVTIYSVAVGQPDFGVMGPLAIGLALFAAALTGGGFTGAALNPARVLGPSIVFGCGWKAAPVYILAELLGGVAGSVISWPLYGTGLQFGRWFDAVEDAVADARQALRSGYERVAGESHA
jgi:aquaporin TIP